MIILDGFFEEPEVSPSTSVSDVNEVLSVEDPQPSSSGIQFRSIQQRQNGSLDTTQTLPDHHYVNVDQSDDGTTYYAKLFLIYNI